MLDYRTYAEHGSLYNTPPVFAIYVLMLVTRWIRDEIGGLESMFERNRDKAALLYEAIDASGGFYTGHADPGSRSLMNVTFRLPTPDLESSFLAEAAEADLVELRGHRSVGGIRASIYNAHAGRGGPRAPGADGRLPGAPRLTEGKGAGTGAEGGCHTTPAPASSERRSVPSRPRPPAAPARAGCGSHRPR